MTKREKKPDPTTVVAESRGARGVYVRLVHDPRCGSPYLLFAGKAGKQKLLFWWGSSEEEGLKMHKQISKEYNCRG